MEVVGVDWEFDFDVNVGRVGRRIYRSREEALQLTGAVRTKFSEIAVDELGRPADAIRGRHHRSCGAVSCVKRQSKMLVCKEEWLGNARGYQQPIDLRSDSKQTVKCRALDTQG